MKTQRLSTPLALQLPVILFMFLALNMPAAWAEPSAASPSSPDQPLAGVPQGGWVRMRKEIQTDDRSI